MKPFKFSYDAENDDLFIYSDGKSKGAIELGNFVLDFDEKGDLVAMQILDASEILSKVLSKIVEINKISEIKIEITNFRNMDAINFKITSNNQESSASIFIPHIKEKSPVLNY